MSKTKKNKPKGLTLIGRREFIDFPELGYFGIEAKIDTGAFTTAIHCSDIRIETENDKPVLHFKLLDNTHPEYSHQDLKFYQFEEKNIKNSFGNYEKRYIIRAIIKLGPRKIRTTISLAHRGNMRYPVLIGRKFLGKKFLVDVSRVHVCKES